MKRSRGLRSDLMEMYHSCLCEMLRELRDLQDEDSSSGQETKINVAGMGEVHLYFELAMVIYMLSLFCVPSETST